jgi:hypothetical protein
MSCFEQSSFANGFPVNWAILGGGQLGTEMRRKKPARVLHKESPNVQQFWPLSVSVVLSLQYFKPWIGVPASKCSAGTFSFSRRCSPHRITKIEVQWRTDWGFPNSSKLLVGQFHDICSMANHGAVSNGPCPWIYENPRTKPWFPNQVLNFWGTDYKQI